MRAVSGQPPLAVPLEAARALQIAPMFITMLEGLKGERLCCRGNIPDENLLGGEATEDTEIFRYKQISRALRYNALLVSVNTVVHPEGLLQGTSVIGPASNEWPAPSV
jgi:hypothetical protein